MIIDQGLLAGAVIFSVKKTRTGSYMVMVVRFDHTTYLVARDLTAQDAQHVASLVESINQP
jgi:hypothetical protein